MTPWTKLSRFQRAAIRAFAMLLAVGLMFVMLAVIQSVVEGQGALVGPYVLLILIVGAWSHLDGRSGTWWAAYAFTLPCLAIPHLMLDSLISVDAASPRGLDRVDAAVRERFRRNTGHG